ncbi:accessory Sec system protein Asp2 [Staphylococcus aureus]
MNVIDETLEKLNFKSHEIRLSGLSMGSFVCLALCRFSQISGNLIVGKPLVNIGTIAKHMRLLRPEEFNSISTSWCLMKVIHLVSIKALNHRFLANISKEIIVTNCFCHSIYAT